ncbi:alpha/beta hydrolase [Streptomyces sp. PTM05]|uniref:Alpha/beta hydrolase n=1 Tax=Streptantibioticus parmotrematis TaxID=2873249 RepID=A0ABS7QRH2_9ACTN|nr:alpha/beta hydrolase [Streptantibioticus parmotrematis]MBY8884447.1 alpha/beta hydrolase [Streptantibioticus parmotrematis]
MRQVAESAGGVRIAYERDGRGDPALVLVHGWCCDRSYFAPQHAHFTGERAVVSLDLRGHGDSDRPDPGDPGCYTVAAFADDVRAVIRHAGLRRPVVVGHSLGGLVALACAAFPDEVGAAVLVDPAPLAKEAAKARFARSVAEVAADHDGSWRRGFAARRMLATDTARREETIAGAAVVPAAVAAEGMRAMAEFDGAGALARAAVPLLAITADEPEPALREHPGVALGRTVGAGHFVQLEVPDQVDAMLERFLRVVLPGAATA